MRRASLMALFMAACDPSQTSGGAGSTSPPPSIQPIVNSGDSQSGSTPTGTVSPCEPLLEAAPSSEPVVTNGPLVDVPAATTILGGPAGEIIGTTAAAADFDGDGDTDLAILTTRGVEVWFAPIPAGTLEVGGSPALITVPDDPSLNWNWIQGSGDLDGDGREEVQIGARFVPVPGSGTFAAETTALATLERPDHAVVADVDADGFADLITMVFADYTNHARIDYGPISGLVSLSAVAGPESAILLTDRECAVNPRGVFGDTNGNGTPELLVTMSGNYCDWGAKENLMWELGDFRGQELSPSAILSKGPNASTILGDVDGDGFPELTDGSSVFRLADLAESGSAACPIASVPAETGSFATYGSHTPASSIGFDLSGDGLAEVLLNPPGSTDPYRVIEGSATIGIVNPSVAGVPISTLWPDVLAGDFNGDGIHDIAWSSGSAFVIVSGAELRSRWLESNQN